MPSNINTVIVEGRVSKEPNYRKTQNNKSLCRFSIANNKYFYNDNELKSNVYFFEIVSWGRIADKVAINAHKGCHILVEGELRQESYISKSGDKKQSVYILANSIKYLDKRYGNVERVASKQTINKDIEEALEISF